MGIPFKAIGELAKALGKITEKVGRLGAREVPKRVSNIRAITNKGKKLTGSSDATKNNIAVKDKRLAQKPPVEENIGGGQRTSFKIDPLGLLEGKMRMELVPESPGHPTMKPRTIIDLINF